MDTIGKFKTNFLGKNKSFKIGFNNRSPFSYITGTGVGQPSFADQGVKSLEPSDWKAAYDTSDAVAAEAKAAQKAGVAGGKAFTALVNAAAGGVGGETGGLDGKGGGFSEALGIDYGDAGDAVSIFFYKGTSGVDVTYTDVTESIKAGDQVQVLKQNYLTGSSNQDMRTISGITTSDTVVIPEIVLIS